MNVKLQMIVSTHREIILSYEPEDMSDIIDHLLQTKVNQHVTTYSLVVYI